jgi:hypothetical protein
MWLRNARRVPTVVRTPAHVWLTVRMAAWSLVLPVLKRLLPLPRLARLMWSDGRGHSSGEDHERVVTLARWICSARVGRGRDNCLDRAFLTYRFLAMASANPRLVVGMRSGERVAGHAWVTLNGRTVHGAGESPDDFVAVVAFGRGGAREEPA